MSLLQNGTLANLTTPYYGGGGGGGGGGSVSVSTIVSPTGTLNIQASTITGSVGVVAQSYTETLPGAIYVPAGGLAVAPLSNPISTIAGAYYQVSLTEAGRTLVPAGAPADTDATSYIIGGQQYTLTPNSLISTFAGGNAQTMSFVFEGAGTAEGLLVKSNSATQSTFITYVGSAVITKLT